MKKMKTEVLLALIAVWLVVASCGELPDGGDVTPHQSATSTASPKRFPAGNAGRGALRTVEDAGPYKGFCGVAWCKNGPSRTPVPTMVRQSGEASSGAPYGDAAGRYAKEAEYLAKTVYGEALVCSRTEQAAVIWCVLNRVDSGYWSGDIIEVITQPSQFHGYDAAHPVLPELYELALDVLDRWQREKGGEVNVGRVLPKEYRYFTGDSKRNHFRTEYSGGLVWDWSLQSPYE